MYLQLGMHCTHFECFPSSSLHAASTFIMMNLSQSVRANRSQVSGIVRNYLFVFTGDVDIPQV